MDKRKLVTALTCQDAVRAPRAHLDSFFDIFEVKQSNGKLRYHQDVFDRAQAREGDGIKRNPASGERHLPFDEQASSCLATIASNPGIGIGRNWVRSAADSKPVAPPSRLSRSAIPDASAPPTAKRRRLEDTAKLHRNGARHPTFDKLFQ